MELLIFNPPRYRNSNHFKFNNALLWLASYLYQRGVEVRIIPLNNEHLRKVLGERRYLKPYFSDEALDEVLAYIHQNYDNFAIDLSTLMGLPYEQQEDVQAIKPFSDYFYDKFEDVRYPYVSPMNVEPGSLVLRSPDQYNRFSFVRHSSISCSTQNGVL